MDKNLKQVVMAAEAVKRKFKKMRSAESEYDKSLEMFLNQLLVPSTN